MQSPLGIRQGEGHTFSSPLKPSETISDMIDSRNLAMEPPRKLMGQWRIGECKNQNQVPNRVIGKMKGEVNNCFILYEELGQFGPNSH